MQGMILADRYECLKRIGSGGMGDVYKAHDRRLDRIVAIKVLKSEYNEDDNFIRKFRRESLAAASISHPNIVSIYDVGMETVADEDVYYIVMEYIDGKTLKELIKEEGMLSQNQALNYLIQIAEALKIAHNKNIIHRDIKSQNIMVTRDNRVKVTDFGIARMAGNATVTVTNAVMGSVHYFSPEQARGQKVDARSDIYSMGIVLFEMLTGEVPFDSENPITVALMHVQNEIPMPSERNPRVSPEVDRVFRHMTEKKPSDRYENVSLIIEDVKAILLGKVYKVYGDHSQTETRTTVVIPPRVNRSSQARAASRDTAPHLNRNTQPIPPKKPKKKSNPLATIGGVLLALLLLFGLAFGGSKIKDMLLSNEKGTAVEMIDLIGKDVSEAKDFAASNDLSLEIDEKESDEGIEPGTILSQSVDAGEVINRGDQFSIVIAKETEQVKVPDLENMTISEAQSTLRSAGLNLIVDKTEFSDDVPADRIISQSPKADEKIKKGDSVHVVMSKGADDKMTVVPNLKGVTLEKARALLSQQGLKLGNVEEREDISVGPGEIVWQQYNSGNQVKEGTAVDVIISKRSRGDQGGEENGGTTSHKNLSYRVPDDGNTHEIEVVIQSGGNERTVNHEEVGSGSAVSYPVQGSSGDSAYMRVDGRVVKTVDF